MVVILSLVQEHSTLVVVVRGGCPRRGGCPVDVEWGCDFAKSLAPHRPVWKVGRVDEKRNLSFSCMQPCIHFRVELSRKEHA